MDGLARRYLLVPGLRSSNIHVYDTQPDPRTPQLVKTIDGKELSAKAGYSRPHTLHCGPDGVFLTCLGGAGGRRRRAGRDRPARPRHVRRAARLGDRPRPAVLPLRRLVAPQPERADHQRVGHPLDDRGRRSCRSCCWARSTGTPSTSGTSPRAGTCSASTWARSTRWRWRCGRRHDPEATWGFVGVVISTEDLSGSIWRWFRDGDKWTAEKVITIPAEPADPDLLPPALKPFGAVPPLITDIDLSVDDRFLYVSCWGTGELKQYDVSDPAHPTRGGIRAARRDRRPRRRTRRARHAAGRRAADGRGQPRRPARLLHQLALRGLGRPVLPGRRRRLDGQARRGPRRRAEHRRAASSRTASDFRGLRVHQIRLQGGDASSDSYCYR